MRRPIACVYFTKCGAEAHPAFKNAFRFEGTTFALDFPIKEKSFLKSHAAQQRWADDKMRHLRSWPGSNPHLEWIDPVWDR